MNSLSAIKCVLLLAVAATATPVFAQQSKDSFPTRPIKFVSISPPGGTADVVGRRVGQDMSTYLGQQIIIENRPGAGSIIGSEYVARSEPDGYTLLVGSTNSHVFNQWLYKKLSYDPMRDFIPITRMFEFGNVLVLPSSLNVNSIPELVALAKQRKNNPLTYVSGGIGSTSHLSAELLKINLGIDLVHVPYKGMIDGMTDLVSGRVDMLFGNVSSVLPFIKSGQLKALTITSRSRSSLLPDIPTVREIGLDNVQMDVWIGLFAPKGTPPAIVNALSEAAKKALQQPATQASFVQDGGSVVSDNTPAAFSEVMKEEIERWGRVIKSANITVD